MVAIHPSTSRKPGLKTLVRQDQEKKRLAMLKAEQDAAIAKAKAEQAALIADIGQHNSHRIWHILTVFAKYPARTGRIDCAEFFDMNTFDEVDMYLHPHVHRTHRIALVMEEGEMGPSKRDYGFMRAVARIFLNCRTELQLSKGPGQLVDWMLFIREVDEQNTGLPVPEGLDYNPFVPIVPSAMPHDHD